MRSASLYRVGGNALLLGAVLYAVALLLHAPQPMDLAAYGALPQGPWMAAHWLFAVGAVFASGGLVALARHLFQTDGEGWAVLGLGANIVTAGLFVAIVAPEIVAFPVLAQMSAGGTSPGAQDAYTAVNLNLMSMVHVAGPLFWIGVACYGLAMLRDAVWPRWLAQAGIAVGIVEVVSGFVLGDSWMAFKLVFVLGCAWLAFTGYTLARMKRAPAPK